jgi:hypothetical protein
MKPDTMYINAVYLDSLRTTAIKAQRTDLLTLLPELTEDNPLVPGAEPTIPIRSGVHQAMLRIENIEGVRK